MSNTNQEEIITELFHEFVPKLKLNSVALVHKRTVPTEWPPLLAK
jgi:hypothetical protein